MRVKYLRGILNSSFFFDQITRCFSATTFEPKVRGRLSKKIPFTNLKASTRLYVSFYSIGIRLHNQKKSNSLQEFLLKSSLVPKVTDCFLNSRKRRCFVIGFFIKDFDLCLSSCLVYSSFQCILHF